MLTANYSDWMYGIFFSSVEGVGRRNSDSAGKICISKHFIKYVSMASVSANIRQISLENIGY